MKFSLLQALEDLRHYVRRPIHIHCGYENRPTGLHPEGRAADLHIDGLHPMEQMIAASRFPAFTGIGVYLWWDNPGLHLDTRILVANEPRALWGSTAEKVYVPFDLKFFKAAAALPWPPGDRV